MEQDKQNKKNPDTLKWLIIGVVIFVIAVLLFGAGMFVGGMKARFSYRWAENYHQNFGGPQGGFMGDWRLMPPDRGFIQGHGTFGQIIKIEDSTLVIKGRNDVEKIILIKDNTIIERLREAIKPADLKIDDYVVVIGAPNDAGQIEAKLIRVMPSGESSFGPFPPLSL